MSVAARAVVKRDTLNLRIKAETRGLIDRAAKLAGKNRTDFVLDAARQAAEDALAERTVFSFKAKAYREFVARLDAPPEGERASPPESGDPGALGMSAPLSPPEPLADHHQIDDLSSGEPSLDAWLKRRARANQASGATRTFVACEGSKVFGYYALASGAVTVESVPGRFRRNMPDPVPVVILARLAVDQAHRGRGMGRALFRDSARRVAQAADTIGIRGIVVHAMSEDARAFYLALGFDPCPGEPMTLVTTLADIRSALGL